MSFMKGAMLGAMMTAGAMMMYSENIDFGKKKITKKGRQLVKKMKMM